ncbi:MAG TPA: murein biosynthesis integral membrane protein MurJ [Ktedonobacterales bacterium]|jgi:putative peptidoglycan lipid II flippase
MGVNDTSLSVEAINGAGEQPVLEALPEHLPQTKQTTIHAGRAISVVFFVSIAARVLTLVSQALIAATFGTSDQMAAYTLALIVPATLAGILTTAVGAAIIPVFIEYREHHGEQEAMRLLWIITTLSMLVLVVVTGVLVAAAPLLVQVFSHQLNASTQALATILMRFLMPVLLLQGLITLVGAVLNAYGRFAAASLLPAANALCIIAFLLLGEHAWGIYALGWGTVAGYALNLLLLIVVYLRLGLRFHPGLHWRHPGVVRIVVLSSPALFSALLVNGNILIDQFMASLLPARDFASLSYAVKLVDTPAQFFYIALSSALLPVFSLQVARRQFDLLSSTFRRVVIYAAIVLLPAGALLSVLAHPVVEALFQRGRFDGLSTDIVAGAMLLLAPSIFLFSYSFINGRIYNARQDNKTLRNVSVLSLALNGVLDYVFMQFWGVAGIAFSTTLTYLIAATVLIVLLNRKLPGIRLPQLGLAVGKAALAAALMWVVCAALQQVQAVEQLQVLVRLVVLSVVGLVFYLVILSSMRLHELGMLWAMVRARLPFGR